MLRIHARDGAAIKDVNIITITAIEDADVVIVDALFVDGNSICKRRKSCQKF
jgi:hypothetical protein